MVTRDATHRALVASSTAAVVALLFGYHTSTSAARAGGDAQTVVGRASHAAGHRRRRPADRPVPASGSGSSGSGTATTVAGTVAQTRWGPVQVQITVDGGKITDVDGPAVPAGNGKDRQINAYALPILVAGDPRAQSADIDMVSGATVTRRATSQSLQSALDQAGL